MRMPPEFVLLEWPTPNYVDPVVRGPANIIIIAIFLPLAFLVVGIRIYTRIRLSKSFGLDDWFIIATLFPTTAFAVLALLAEVYFGWNRHMWDVHLSTIVAGLKVVLASEILFCLATSLTKISMLTLTYRLVGNSSSILSKITIGAIVLVSTQGTAFIFAILFECQQPWIYWTLSFTPQPQCISETKLILAAGIVNVVTDLVVVLLPLPTVWRVKLPAQQQIILVLLFAVGFLITLVGAVRTYYLYKVDSGWDKTWEADPVWLTGSLELYVGVICASIPATKKFFSRFDPTWLGFSTTTTPPPTNLAPSAQLSSHRRSYLQEENEVGVFPLEDYGDDKKAAGVYSTSKIEGLDKEYEYTETDVERPQTAYSRGSEYTVNRTNSRDDLVQNHDASRVDTPDTFT